MTPKKAKAHRKGSMLFRKRYTPRLRQTPAIYCECGLGEQQDDELDAVAQWINKQSSRRKKVWLSPCCGAAQTGARPLFEEGHLIDPIELPGQLRLKDQHSALALKELLTKLLPADNKHKVGCFWLPFVGKRHLSVQNSRNYPEQAFEVTELDEPTFSADCELTLLRQQVQDLTTMKRELEAKTTDLASQVDRLREHIYLTKRPPSVASTAAQTSRHCLSKAITLSVTKFTAVDWHYESWLPCSRKANDQVADRCRKLCKYCCNKRHCSPN